jgi:hypothetical protein
MMIMIMMMIMMMMMDDDDNNNVFIRLQHGQEFHNLVYMSYVKLINPYILRREYL